MVHEKRVLRNLAWTKRLRLRLGGVSGCDSVVDSLVGYVDSDFAGDVAEFKSTTGYAFRMGTGLICWKSSKQSITTTSTADAEFKASAAAIGDLLWLRELVAGICRYAGSADLGPTVLYNDNQSTLSTFAVRGFRPHSRQLG